MAKTLSADELDLLTFFECDPVLLDHGVPWFYNDVAYAYKHQGDELSFAIMPAYGDVRIRHLKGDCLVFELNAVAVDDVRYRINDDREEALDVIMNAMQMTIKLKPFISIIQIFRGKDM